MANGPLPPGPKRKLFPFAGIFRDPLRFFSAAARDHGDIVCIASGPQKIFLLNHPDYVADVFVTNQNNFAKGRALEKSKQFLGDGLLTNEGESHRRQRRLVQPAFHRSRVMSYGKTMTDYTLRMSAQWKNGSNLDIAEEMSRLALHIVAKTLFNADVETEAKEIGAALSTIIGNFNRVMLPFSELLIKLPWPSTIRLRRAMTRLDETIFRFIEERRASGRDAGDLLSMLLLAQDEEAPGRGMTDKQVRDEAMTLFLAGHETTANWLAWTWYLLSQNPEAEKRLREELERVLGGRTPAVEDVPQLKFAEMILSESLRMFPPAWIVGRRALHDYPVGGYILPAKSIVVVSQWVMHHDERFFPDPFRFDPLRWTPEAKAARPKFSFFPFGGGARVCIGEAFAWMEATLILATLAQQWRVQLTPGHVVEPLPRITLRPKNGLLMKLEKR